MRTGETTRWNISWSSPSSSSSLKSVISTSVPQPSKTYSDLRNIDDPLWLGPVRRDTRLPSTDDISWRSDTTVTGQLKTRNNTSILFLVANSHSSNSSSLSLTHSVTLSQVWHPHSTVFSGWNYSNSTWYSAFIHLVWFGLVSQSINQSHIHSPLEGFQPCSWWYFFKFMTLSKY